MEEYIGKYVYIDTDKFWRLRSAIPPMLHKALNDDEFYKKLNKASESDRKGIIDLLYEDSKFLQRYGNSYIVCVEDVKFDLNGKVGLFGRSYIRYERSDDEGELEDDGEYEWRANMGSKSTMWFYWNDLEDLVAMDLNEVADTVGDAIIEFIL